MSFNINLKTLLATTCASLSDSRKYAKESYRPDREWTIDTGGLSDKELKDVAAAAEKAGEGKVAKACEAILIARAGKFSEPVPNFKAFHETLRLFLSKDVADGWIWVEQADGRSYPELVQEIGFDDGARAHGKPEPKVVIWAASYGLEHEGGDKYAVAQVRRKHVFTPQDVTRKRVADALAAKGIYKETPALRAAYDEEMARHAALSKGAFGRQFRLTGRVLEHESDGWRRRGERGRSAQGHLGSECGRFPRFPPSGRLRDPEGWHRRGAGASARPVDDLKSHEFYWVSSAFLEPYAYDKTLKDKLVLPASHRDLLDVLTNDIAAFTEDMIEGKAAGNAILCKGAPGLGKTLSAEVYAELTERPLLKVHSGKLGTNPARDPGEPGDVLPRSRSAGAPSAAR